MSIIMSEEEIIKHDMKAYVRFEKKIQDKIKEHGQDKKFSHILDSKKDARDIVKVKKQNPGGSIFDPEYKEFKTFKFGKAFAILSHREDFIKNIEL